LFLENSINTKRTNIIKVLTIKDSRIKKKENKKEKKLREARDHQDKKESSAIPTHNNTNRANN